MKMVQLELSILFITIVAISGCFVEQSEIVFNEQKCELSLKSNRSINEVKVLKKVGAQYLKIGYLELKSGKLPLRKISLCTFDSNYLYTVSFESNTEYQFVISEFDTNSSIKLNTNGFGKFYRVANE